MDKNNDVYIIHQSGSVTIIDEQYADNAIRQARSGGRRVRVFRDRQKYLDYLDELDHEYAMMKKEILQL